LNQKCFKVDQTIFHTGQPHISRLCSSNFMD